MVGCSTIPEVTARVELNTCNEVESVLSNNTTIQAVYPYLEISYNDGNVKLASSNICFSFYLFNANRDTLFVRDFKILGKTNIELFNIFNNVR